MFISFAIPETALDDWTELQALRELDANGSLRVGRISTEDDGFLETRPCLTRAGMPEAEISELFQAARTKVAKLKALRENRGRGFTDWDNL